MEKITEFIVTKGDLHTVLWLSVAIVLAIVYALVTDKSIYYLMISSFVTCVSSLSDMGLSAQIVTFLVLYLCMYLGLKFHNKHNKVTEKKE